MAVNAWTKYLVESERVFQYQCAGQGNDATVHQ